MRWIKAATPDPSQDRTTSKREGPEMFRLMMLLYSIAGTTLAGIGVVVAVSLNMYDMQSIIVSALIGAIVALPVVWLVAKKLQTL
ncbi:hypothetical protein LCM17_22500 [Cereibacter sphaeroides]|nr:hypothetical protein [Cereibacter sphaeroides]